MTIAAPAVPAPIRVDGIGKRYAGRSVLDDVSFQVGAGEICALLGPNGAGKTTTAEIVEGYRTPDRGSVHVLGLDPLGGGPRLRARVGVMLQQGGVDPRMRPLETLRLHARFFRRARDPARLLELAGLATVASTPYRRLSGGERQRLALALALVGEPEVLVLDEPTAGMDPEARATTRGLVSGMRDQGAAILLTTHELADAERLADRIVVIAGGRVVAIGTPTELMAGGGAHLRFRLASELTEPDVVALGRQLGGPILAQGDGRYRLESRAPDPATIAALAAWCAERGLTIVDLRSSGVTLEERYLQLVRGATDG